MKAVVAQRPSCAPSRDAQLLARIANGDLDALGVLYDSYAATLLAFTLRLIGANEAEDLVQNTFLRVLRIARTFDPAVESARPWLFAIAVRIARERQRSFRRWVAALSRLANTSSGAALPARAESDWDVARALEGLPVAKRVVILLTEVEGFSGPEVAEILGIPVGTVWTRLHHARRELRLKLEGQES